MPIPTQLLAWSLIARVIDTLPVAIRWRRLPELRLYESRETMRKVPDPN